MKPKTYTTCIVCGKAKTTPTTRQKGVSRFEYERDPYCSTVCCKADHGITAMGVPTSS